MQKASRIKLMEFFTPKTEKNKLVKIGKNNSPEELKNGLANFLKKIQDSMVFRIF